MCGNLNCFDGCMLPRTHEGLCQGEGSVPRWTYVPVFAQAHLALDAIFAVTEEFWFANNGPRQPARCHSSAGIAAPLRYASYLSAELTDSANDHESPPQFQVSTKCHRQRKPHIDRLGRWFVGTRFSRWSQVPCGARTLFSIELLPLTEIVLLCKPKSPLNTNSLLALVVVVGDFFCRSFGGFSGLTSCTTHSPALPPHASAPYKLPKKFSGSVPENLGERCNFHWFSTANNVTSGDIH